MKKTSRYTTPEAKYLKMCSEWSIMSPMDSNVNPWTEESADPELNV